MSEIKNQWESFLFSPSVKEDDLVRLYKYRLLIFITVITGLLMWTYAFISLFFITGRTLTVIALASCIGHALSPVVYRFSRSMVVSAYSMVACGMIFQFTFSYYTGGFFSPTLIWFAVLPLIVGLLTNKTHASLWTFICVCAYVCMFYLHHAGLVPEANLSELARTLTQFLIGLGLISLVGGFTLFFLELGYFYHHKPKGP